MKSKANLTALYLLIAIFLVCSCRKDDCPVIDDPVIDDNPDNPEGLDSDNDLIGSADYLTLIDMGTSKVNLC